MILNLYIVRAKIFDYICILHFVAIYMSFKTYIIYRHHSSSSIFLPSTNFFSNFTFKAYTRDI